MGKASFRKRLRREQREALQGLRERVESDPSTRDLPWIVGSGGPKISAALSELIEPYLSENRTLEEFRAWAAIGALAWNSAIEPDLVSREKLEELLKRQAQDETAFLHGALDELRQRKLELFPDDRRLIIKTEVLEQSDGSFYLTAAAAAHEDELARRHPL